MNDMLFVRFDRQGFGSLIRVDGQVRNARFEGFRGPDTVFTLTDGRMVII